MPQSRVHGFGCVLPLQTQQHTFMPADTQGVAKPAGCSIVCVVDRCDVPVLPLFGMPDALGPVAGQPFEYESLVPVRRFVFCDHGMRSEMKAMVSFPLSPDMPMQDNFVNHAYHEENVKQLCEHGCNARHIFEQLYNKPNRHGKYTDAGRNKAQEKANEYVHKSRVYIRSLDEHAALPRLRGSEQATTFVVAHCDNVHLYMTVHGEFVQVMFNPVLTSYSPNDVISLPMSYSHFGKCWHPTTDTARLEKNFTRVQSVRVAQLHRHVPLQPTNASLAAFQAVLGPIPPFFTPMVPPVTSVRQQSLPPVVAPMESPVLCALQQSCRGVCVKRKAESSEDDATTLAARAPPLMPLLPARASEVDPYMSSCVVALDDTEYTALMNDLPLSDLTEFDDFAWS